MTCLAKVIPDGLETKHAVRLNQIIPVTTMLYPHYMQYAADVNNLIMNNSRQILGGNIGMWPVLCWKQCGTHPVLHARFLTGVGYCTYCNTAGVSYLLRARALYTYCNTAGDFPPSMVQAWYIQCGRRSSYVWSVVRAFYIRYRILASTVYGMDIVYTTQQTFSLWLLCNTNIVYTTR